MHYLFVLLFLSFITAYSAHAELPPQVEADSLAMEAKTAIDSQNYSVAARSLEKLRTLNVPLPESYEYYYGIALQGLEKYGKAMNMFELYLNKGNGTKFYEQALRNYNYCKNKYFPLKEQYDKDLKQYQEESATYNQRYESAKKSDEQCQQEGVACSINCSKKYGGFFGSYDKESSCREWCWIDKCDKRNKLKVPQLPTKPE